MSVRIRLLVADRLFRNLVHDAVDFIAWNRLC